MTMNGPLEEQGENLLGFSRTWRERAGQGLWVGGKEWCVWESEARPLRWQSEEDENVLTPYWTENACRPWSWHLAVGDHWKVWEALASPGLGPLWEACIGQVGSKAEGLRAWGLQMVPNLWWFSLQFSNSTVCENDNVFHSSCTSKCKFWSFPGLMICSKILSHDTGQWQWATALVIPAIKWLENQYTQNHSFTFSTIFSNIYEIFSALL